MSDLVEFLNARVADDERAAAARAGEAPIHQIGCYYYDYSLASGEFCDCSGPDHAAIEASVKRQILDEHNDQHECTDLSGAHYPYQGCRTLRILATVYSTHADYQPSWA